MTLRGKDFCNCEHAQLLRAAIEDALAILEHTKEMADAQDALYSALCEDNEAAHEYQESE